MATPDAALFTALGVDPSAFPEQTFRDGVQFAMQMGKHPDPDKQLVFLKEVSGTTYWRNGVELVDDPELDREGSPLDPEVEVRTTADQEISVDYAIEVEGSNVVTDSGVGVFRPTRLTITLADAAYAQVKDCQRATYNGDRFLYSYEPESVGLFGVAFHTLVYVAEDDT